MGRAFSAKFANLFVIYKRHRYSRKSLSIERVSMVDVTSVGIRLRRLLGDDGRRLVALTGIEPVYLP
jgi:hypothetical protein